MFGEVTYEMTKVTLLDISLRSKSRDAERSGPLLKLIHQREQEHSQQRIRYRRD